MAQRLVTSFINTVIPGAYPDVTVQSQPVGLGASGILVIVGESDGGNSYQNVPLKSNFFTPDQLSQVMAQYISGPIVDAFSALTAPSNDADITGTANQIYIVKTNASVKAHALLAASSATPLSPAYGSIQDKNWGAPGNNYKYQITELQAEVTPQIQGNTIVSFGALTGMSFSIRLEGGASTVVGPLPAVANVAALVIALNAELPSGITASAGTASNSIALTINTDPYANAQGWGKSFELIDSTPGDLAALGLVAGMQVSSAEPEVELMVNNATTGLSETLNALPDVALMLGYQGTSGTVTINAATQMLTTTVVGGSGANLSINMAQYRTIADLATYIASQTGYSASAAASAQQQPPNTLDSVTAQGIASTGVGLMPGRIKDAASSFQAAIGTSNGVQFVPTATAGLPASMAVPAYLSGGSRGGTLANDIVNAVAQIGGIQCNIIVPLFSQDSSADIAAGVTASSSTYTIAAINAIVKNHCIEYSTPSLKRNRICILSYNGTFANAQTAAQGLANYRCSLCFQQPTQVNSQGVITVFQPWYAAVVAAGMQAGGFYKSITNKLANVISFADPSGFDSGNPGDIEEALNSGMLMLSPATAGSLWVSDQTTYGFDTNFVYNSIQAVYASDILALDLASSFQTAFVGKSLADVDAATGLSYLAQKMDGYKKLKLIAASDDAPLGWKNPKITILAPTMTVAVEIKLATAIYFIPISISISQVQQSA